MIRWIIEDAIHTIIAFVSIFGTILICTLLGVFPLMVVGILLLMFWGAGIGVYVKISKLRKKMNSEKEGKEERAESSSD